MPKRTTDYRTALLEDLKNPDEAANYLNAAREESDDAYRLALRDVAEARKMTIPRKENKEEPRGVPAESHNPAR